MQERDGTATKRATRRATLPSQTCEGCSCRRPLRQCGNVVCIILLWTRAEDKGYEKGYGYDKGQDW